MAKTTKWSMRVYYLDSCNCDWGCPCQFNARPTHGNCEGVGGIHVIKGSYGRVRLDGLNFVWIGSWPGPIHEGRGRVSIYIDDRADDEQFGALSEISTGRAGGGPFEVYMGVVDELQEPRRAKVAFQAKGLDSRVRVGNVAEAHLEPIRNPVTGKIHRAVIELPEGFEASRMHQSSTKKIAVDDGHLKFEYSGTYGSFQKATWKGP